jgi:hypothetical protein
VWPRTGPRRWKAIPVQPALPVDAIRAYDAGLGVNEADRLEYANTERDHGDWFDSGWHDDFGPMDSVHAAFFEVECDKSAQEHEMWSAAQLGALEGEAPQFLTRVGRSIVRDGVVMGLRFLWRDRCKP